MRITIRNRGSDVLQLEPRKVREANVFLQAAAQQILSIRAQVAAAVGAHRKLGHNATADSVLAFPSII